MSGFSSDWLALREPADHRARRHELLDRLDLPANDRPIRLVDLGTGTGSNLRYLLPRLGPRQQWRLVDNDPALLDDLPVRLAPWAESAGLTLTRDGETLRIDAMDGVDLSARIDTQALDLAGDLEGLGLRDVDLVTCSALLDLFSAERLAALADVIARARCRVLFSLSYDGRVRWTPSLPFDERATGLLNAHQRRNKGLGDAAGPDAAMLMVEALRARDYDVVVEPADWQLRPAQAALQRMLLDGWADALREQQPELVERIRDWHRSRLRSIGDGDGDGDGDGTLQVGHLDLAAVPR